jgi:protein required for attachment to host cells
MKATKTWILIADGGRARILENDGPGRGLRPVEGMTFAHPLPRTHELVRDHEPRSFESVGRARHPVDTGLDPHRKEKEKFAVDLASLLAGEASKKAFDRLVIVAPAKAMGELRAALPKPVKDKVHKEIVRDLTKTPDHEVEKHLGDVVAL